MSNPLLTLPLRYLIGVSDTFVKHYKGKTAEIFEGPYDADKLVDGPSIAYCNLLDQEGNGEFAPYLKPNDTARQYNERVVDPEGDGWVELLVKQMAKRRGQGFKFVEWDNPDAYGLEVVLDVYERTAKFDMGCIAKNPWLVEDGEDFNSSAAMIAHPNVFGAIVEKDCGTPDQMYQLREEADKPEFPIWFVSFDRDGKLWADKTVEEARRFKYMSVTHSHRGEYETFRDLLLPNT